MNPNRKLGFCWNKNLDKADKKRACHASINKEIPESILGVSSRTTMKILRRLKIGCSRCNWYVEDVVGDLHHIIPKKEGGLDLDDNLTYLCPNCHREAGSGKIDRTTFIPFKQYVGEKWKDFVYYK